MNGFEEKPEGSGGGEFGELREEVQSLRTWFCAALMVMIVFSLSANLFFFKQISVAGAQISSTETAADLATRNFNTPKAIDFWNRLVQDAHSHPDFVPVINKYSPVLSQTLLGNSARTSSKAGGRHDSVADFRRRDRQLGSAGGAEIGMGRTDSATTREA